MRIFLAFKTPWWQTCGGKHTNFSTNPSILKRITRRHEATINNSRPAYQGFRQRIQRGFLPGLWCPCRSHTSPSSRQGSKPFFPAPPLPMRGLGLPVGIYAARRVTTACAETNRAVSRVIHAASGKSRPGRAFAPAMFGLSYLGKMHA